MSFHTTRKHALHGTLAAAALLRSRISKLLAYPSRGTQADGSSHSRVPAAWDGTGTAPVGWTRAHARIRKHSSLLQWAVAANGDIQAALDQFGVERLTLLERTAVQSAITAAITLDESWHDADDSG